MKLFGFSYKTFLVGCITLLVMTVALWLDLNNEGLVWELLWDVTGETEPVSQLLGASQYVASFARPQPHTAPNANIQHIPDNPFGINTFLQLEAEPVKRARQIEMIEAAGFGWIRQEFTWEDIEIDGRGDFTDRRNVEAVGEISAWDKYDNIVDLVEASTVDMIVRVSNAPSWAQPAVTTEIGPPENVQDFVDFITILAERYKGRITHYQIWNEPNLYPEWGEQQIDPASYADMLCRAYNALKAVDPNIVVHTAALGPTIDLSGRDAYDLLYLQRLYDEGIKDCFDVLSAQGYGLFSGPTDQRSRQFVVNYSRHRWLRDIMVANGDAEKPIWISEAGWNPVPTEGDIWGRETYGIVTMDEAAEYIPIAYERALTDWDWIGTISYWFMKRPDLSEQGQSWYYFRLVEPDFTPTPLYDSFKEMTQSNEWQTWRGQKSWSTRARERLPQVLVLGWGLLFSIVVMSQALIKRVLG